MNRIISYTLAISCLLLSAADKCPAEENSTKATPSPTQSKSSNARKTVAASGNLAGTAKTTASSKAAAAAIKSNKASAKAAEPAATTHKTKAPTQAKHSGAGTGKSAHKSAGGASAPATATKDGKPIWLDLKSARLAAKLKSKPVFADFYTDWCSWCKVMDRTTFHDPKVEDYLARNFVCMRLNAQDGADGEELAHRYNVEGFPTFMVFDSKGKALGQFDGYRKPDELLAAIKGALAFRPPASTKRP